MGVLLVAMGVLLVRYPIFGRQKYHCTCHVIRAARKTQRNSRNSGLCRLIRHAKSKGISWVAWVFDPDWSPQMIKDWNYQPTMQGKHFREVMLKENKH
jgi:hypothetical protein